MTLTAITRTRLEKAASDNGFDVELGPAGAWLRFGSSHAPVRLWLTEWAGSLLIAAFSHPGLVQALAEHGTPVTHPLPEGAVGARGVTDYAQLHPLLRRAILLGRALPTALWESFAARTAELPRATEAERLVIQRVGQDLFRAGLLDYWDGRCAISGLAVPELLRASHIKPWADCQTDPERLDVYNGLLLAAHLDAAFDSGFITLADDGRVLVSPRLDPEAAATLGLDRPARARGLAEGHRRYLPWHRERLFRAG